MGNAVEDQQLGCLWQGTNLLSISLSGFINYLDVNNPSTPLRVVKVGTALLSPCLPQSFIFLLSQGQNTNLNSLTYASDTVYAGSMDGRINIHSSLFLSVLCVLCVSLTPFHATGEWNLGMWTWSRVRATQTQSAVSRPLQNCFCLSALTRASSLPLSPPMSSCE